jgi:hypothetical protein
MQISALQLLATSACSALLIVVYGVVVVVIGDGGRNTSFYICHISNNSGIGGSDYHHNQLVAT